MKRFCLFFLVFVFVYAGYGLDKNSAIPNLIVIFCDDLGYGDLSCYGSVWNQTPEIDRMASEGVKFTDFYSGAPVCTPSRAGLMTGCYARRVDLDLDHNQAWVLFPKAAKGINPDEIILPEMLKQAGYSTAIIGKWHLGDQPEFLPVRHGFDYWFGLPYSNDMGIKTNDGRMLPLMQNETVIESIGRDVPEDQAILTKRYTEEAIQWMDENKKHPFFLYLAHTMPHVPVAATEKFHTQTNNPDVAYGASIAEISWSTGQILDFLKMQKLEKNTLVLFTSDNGGAIQRLARSSNGILKGSKGQTTEGGVRVPCIAWWPGKIAPGTTCHDPASVLDFYSTFAALAKIPLNDNVIRDGSNISDYFFNPGKEREIRPYFYWHVGYLMAVRYGDWKLNLLNSFSEQDKQNIQKSTYKNVQFSDRPELYNLKNDPGEKNDVSTEHPEVVDKILKMAEKEKAALGEYTNQGPEVRKTVYVESPKGLIQ